MRLPKTREEVIGNILTYDEAIRNIDRYSDDVQRTLLQTMSLAFGWVFIRRDGEYRAAPLKFAGGAVGMTPESYHENKEDLGGTSASKRIGEIFYDDGNDWDDYALDENHKGVKALRKLVRSHGKDLKSIANFYGLPGESIDDTERAKVDRIMQQIARENLSDKAHDALVIRLSA